MNIELAVSDYSSERSRQMACSEEVKNKRERLDQNSNGQLRRLMIEEEMSALKDVVTLSKRERRSAELKRLPPLKAKIGNQQK